MVTILTAANWPIIGQICWVLGKVMDFIYTALDTILPTDAGLVGLSIIIYTLFVYTLMLPLTISQQRQTRMTQAMNPELQAIQKKYKNRRDQESQMKQQEEMQEVYDKYGVSMWSGCLPMLIQLPLLFALYPVIYDIDSYVPALETAPAEVNQFLTIPNMQVSPWTMLTNSSSFDLPQVVIIITAIALPVLSGVTQYLNIKLSQSMNGTQQQENSSMGSSMRWMNMFMPLFSVWLVATLPAGIGLYWIVSAVVRSVQQVLINRHLEKTSLDEMVEKNREKAEQKKEKRKEKNGERAERVNAMAQTSTRSITSKANSVKKNSDEEKAKQEKLAQARENAKHAEPGSLTDRANMVQRFNENK